MKRFTLIGFIMILSISMLVACGGGSDNLQSEGNNSSGTGGSSNPPSQGTSVSDPNSTTNTQFKVGIVQLVEHAALDAAYHGFVDGLAELGYVEGKNITFDYHNAQGEQANANTIASKLVNDRNDLILAIATPAAQAVANATTEIPILITAVTDPADAKLVASNDAPGANVTGTSDLTPVAPQMELLTKLVPNAQKVAMLYNSSEANSELQVKMAKEALAKLGLEGVDYTVSNTNEVQQVVESMIGKVDAIYTPTDNMIASSITTITTIANDNGLPIISGESAHVDAGALATYGLNYYDLGVLTAQMAVKVLEGSNPADMPIQYLEKFDLVVNEETARKLNISIPDGL